MVTKYYVSSRTSLGMCARGIASSQFGARSVQRTKRLVGLVAVPYARLGKGRFGRELPLTCLRYVPDTFSRGFRPDVLFVVCQYGDIFFFFVFSRVLYCG